MVTVPLKKKIVGFLIAGVLVASIIVPALLQEVQGKHNTPPNPIPLILNQILGDLQFKKRFYQFVNDTGTTLAPNEAVIAKVRVVKCAPELEARDACAFNVESLLIESDIADNSNNTGFVRGLRVDGISSNYFAILGDGDELGLEPTLVDNKVNFLTDSLLAFVPGQLQFIGPPGVIGASNEVAVVISAASNTNAITITKIEFNGEQPQGIQLELVVEPFVPED
jgi:hypothetical protein